MAVGGEITSYLRGGRLGARTEGSVSKGEFNSYVKEAGYEQGQRVVAAGGSLFRI